MGGDDAPAAERLAHLDSRKPHPNVALPAGACAAMALELGVGGREIGAVGRDHGVEDLAALAVPAGQAADGLPSGLTFVCSWAERIAYASAAMARGWAVRGGFGIEIGNIAVA